MSDPGRDHVLVTGAGSGIGRHVAELYAARGASLSLFDRHFEGNAVHLILTRRRSATQVVHTETVDVTDAAGVAAAVERVVGELGPPRVVFHAAGVGGFSRPFLEFPAQRFEDMVRINLFGTRHVAAAVLPHMRAGSHLALVASLAGLTTAYGQAGYAASKHAVVGLGSVLRTECRPRGIAVSLICPPEIDTPMAQSERRDRPPETAAMKLFAGVVDLDAGCRYMIDRLERGQFLIIPGRRARFAWWLQKLLPRRLTNALADRMVARARHS